MSRAMDGEQSDAQGSDTVSGDVDLDDLPERLERSLALILEYPDVSLNKIYRAEYEDRNGNEVVHNPDLSSVIDGVHAGNIHEFAEAYFEEREKPDVSHISVEKAPSLDEIIDADSTGHEHDDSALYMFHDDPRELVRERGESLGLSSETIEQAVDIVEECAEAGLLSGRKSRPFAGGACYIASILNHEKRNQDEIAEAFDTNTVSIRDHYTRQAEEIGKGWLI